MTSDTLSMLFAWIVYAPDYTKQIESNDSFLVVELLKDASEEIGPC
jgi:hypothetical protein